MNLNIDPAMRKVAAPALAVVMALGVVGCSGESASSHAAATTPSTQESLVTRDKGLADPAKKFLAAHIISTFENSTTAIQYDYAEDIHDGRGITAGRAGFTSGTSDLLEVVKRYSAKNPNNQLAQYLPALKTINAKPKNERDTKGLDGFTQDWTQASNSDPLLNQTQDEVVDDLYFKPAMRRAEAAGIHSSVGQLIFLDTIVQHGEGQDPDGLPAIIEETTNEVGHVHDNEVAWLETFLQIRKQHLEHAADPGTRKDWRESVSRVETLHSFFKDGNLTLDPPISWTVYGDKFTCSASNVCKL